jgi:phospholipase/carboxylesterase
MLKYLTKLHPGAEDGNPVMVLLHGRGSDMGDLQGLSGLLSEGASLITPQAPHPGAAWGYGPGWAWYRYLGEDVADPSSLAESLASLDGFLESLPEILGFTPGPLVLGGFSQGGTTSVAYAASRPGRVAGVVNLSGFLVSPESLALDLGSLEATPIFWAHGTQDPAVPFHLAVKGRDRLMGANVRLEATDYDMGHWVSPEEMQALRGWLGREIPGWEGSEIPNG